MTILYSQIYDYLELPERPVAENLQLSTKRLKRVIPRLASSMSKFFGSLDDLSHSCVKGEVAISVKEFLSMLRIWDNLSPHHEGLAEKVAGIRILQLCRKFGFRDWIEEWSLLCMEAGVSRSQEAVEFWLGVKLMNLWWVFGNDDPVDMSIGFGRNTVVKQILAASSDEILDSDLYT